MKLRRSILPVALGLFALSAGPAHAADPPTTAITTPADNYRAVINKDVPATDTITVSGTVTGVPDGPTAINLRCYYVRYYGGSNYDTLKIGVPVTGGTFSYTGLANGIADNDRGCRLRAVPNTGASNDLSLYSGPRTWITTYDPTDSTYQTHLAPGTPQPADFYASMPGPGGSSGFYSAGSDGLYHFAPTANDRGEPAEQVNGGGYGWDDGGALYRNDEDSQRSTVRVDGINVYDAYATPTFDYDGGGAEPVTKPSGWTPLTSDLQLGANGDVKITEGSTLEVCSNSAVYPATAASCPSVGDSGVHFTRVTLYTADGTKATQTDSYTSTGAAHHVSLQYYNQADDYEYSAWNLPGDAPTQWGVQGNGSNLVNPATPGSIVFRDNEYPDDQYDTANGSLTWFSQPSKIWWSNSSEDVLTEYQLDVPAGGATSVQQVFQVANLSGKALAQANAAEDVAGSPVVDIVAPVNGTATTVPSTTVIAKVRDNKGVKSVTINGVSVTPTSDGTVTLSEPLNEGANTFTIVAADGGGRTGQAATTVTYVKPATPPAITTKDVLAALCKVPSVKRGSTLLSARSAVKKGNCTSVVKKLRSRKVKKGRVISVSPTAGLLLVAKSKVTIAYSAGPPKKKVIKKSR